MSVVRRTKNLLIESLRGIYPVGSLWLHNGQTYRVWEVNGNPNEITSYCAWVRLEGFDGDQIMLYADEAEELEEMTTALVCA